MKIQKEKSDMVFGLKVKNKNGLKKKNTKNSNNKNDQILRIIIYFEFINRL